MIAAIVATRRTKEQELGIQQGDVEDQVDSGSNRGANELAELINEEVEQAAATDAADAAGAEGFVLRARENGSSATSVRGSRYCRYNRCCCCWH